MRLGAWQLKVSNGMDCANNGDDFKAQGIVFTMRVQAQVGDVAEDEVAVIMVVDELVEKREYGGKAIRKHERGLFVSDMDGCFAYDLRKVTLFAEFLKDRVLLFLWSDWLRDRTIHHTPFL